MYFCLLFALFYFYMYRSRVTLLDSKFTIRIEKLSFKFSRYVLIRVNTNTTAETALKICIPNDFKP